MFLTDIKTALNLSKTGINGENEYFKTAVLALLTGQGENLSLVFEKRAQNIRQAGEICFPGGAFEPETDHTFLDTAVRETVEELGILKDDLEIIGKLDTVIAAMGAWIEPYTGWTHLSFEAFKPNPEEVEKLFLVPLQFFLDNPPEEYSVEVQMHPVNFPAAELKLPMRYHQAWKSGNTKILAYQTDYGVIWGITARIIYDLCRKLKGKAGV